MSRRIIRCPMCMGVFYQGLDNHLKTVHNTTRQELKKKGLWWVSKELKETMAEWFTYMEGVEWSKDEL